MKKFASQPVRDLDAWKQTNKQMNEAMKQWSQIIGQTEETVN